jgi:glycosyltransferase involved in cell wall biosynthesis
MNKVDLSSCRLVYVSQSTVPSTQANSIHVVNMVQALSKYFANTILHCKAPLYKIENTIRAIKEIYGIEPKFSLLLLPCFRIKGLSLFNAFLMFLWCLANSKAEKTLIYSRCLYSSYLLSRFSDTPLVYECHAIARSKLQQRLEKAILDSTHVRKLVLITHKLKDDFVTTYRPLKNPHKLLVLPDAANDSLIDSVVAKVNDRAANAINIVYTGSALPGKGIELVLQIAKLISDAHFTLILSTASSLERIPLEGNVSILSNLSNYETLSYQKGADCLLLPNQTEVLTDHGRVNIGNWTSPLKLFEYMGSGKPIVASRIPVLMEILEDGVNCLMANPDDPKEWVSKIQRLNEDPKLAKRIACHARLDFENKYTWSKRAAKLIASLNE